MATTYESGTAVLNGYYLNASCWTVAPVARDGERLPSGRGRWLRASSAIRRSQSAPPSPR